MRFSLALAAALAAVLVGGCNEEHGRLERAVVRSDDVPAVAQIIREDLLRTMSGVRQSARALRRGFTVEDPAQRARDLRLVLRWQQDPRHRDHVINELMISPITFVAAVGTDGHVIARDIEPDPMEGFDLGAAAPVVQRALAGEAGYELSTLPSLEEGDRSSVTIIFAAPVEHDGEVVGAIAAGLPLWRLAQQLTRQRHLDEAEYRQSGGLIWVLMYQGAELHYHRAFPADLRALAPDAASRAEGFEESPHGFTGEAVQFGRWYGYGVLPIPTIADDVGVVIFRSDPD